MLCYASECEYLKNSCDYCCPYNFIWFY